MQPRVPIDQGKSTNHEADFDRSVSTSFRNISFGWQDVTDPTLVHNDNMAGYCWVGATPSGASEFFIEHDLGHVPIGFLVIYTDEPTNVYASGTAWTESKIFLKASGTSANVKIFVLG